MFARSGPCEGGRRGRFAHPKGRQTVLSISTTLDQTVAPAAPPMTRRDTANLFLFGLFLQNALLLIVGSSVLSLFLLTTMESLCYFILTR